ncbi:hypothetical protein DY000_02008670 [Brassica cretica]|uniref:Uncharacterized protein n=1 Tax=Brassica cretica TaxID=69181 RepID=A0ABQ7BWY1_BRACR|nr:hypothetical protein DY000_02008670 [Brassica cretica]
MQDDNKSKKGLAEVYEEEYVQKFNPSFAPATFSDELKKEASMLFKKLCLMLRATLYDACRRWSNVVCKTSWPSTNIRSM